MTARKKGSPAAAESRLTARFLGAVERVGNALPHPATLFASMAVLVVLVSGVAHWRPCSR